MSFARFSSDDWKSDVYVYTNSGDDLVTVHIAGNRHVTDSEGNKVREFIDDELAGQTRHGLTITEAVVFMKTLEARGFHVPDDVIPGLEENPHEIAWSPADLPGGQSVMWVEEAETVEELEDSIALLQGIIDRKKVREAEAEAKTSEQ